MKSEQIAQEALNHALQSQSMTNYPDIYNGFMSKGIAFDDIKPRENVFTFHAWRALGRSVRKGEHGVKIVTFVPVTKKGEDGEPDESFRRPWTTTVFHVSQTQTIS